mgnify:CR=1 FL=1
MFTVSVKELLLWIEKQINLGGNEESFYLLLDIVGGITHKEVNCLRLGSRQTVKLKESLKNISDNWNEHLRTSRPIQHICKATYWRDLKISVNPSVLIPRSETELIIDIVLDLFQLPQKGICFTDLGTGSGALGISLASLDPTWIGYATDFDKHALATAKQNFLDLPNFSNLNFYVGDWWEAFNNLSVQFDLVVSNPPYIPREFYNNLSIAVRNYEPKLALYGGFDGLSHIKNIIRGAPKFLKKNGWLIIENHFDQGQQVKNLFFQSGFNSVKVVNDLSGFGRFTIGRYK